MLRALARVQSQALLALQSPTQRLVPVATHNPWISTCACQEGVPSVNPAASCMRETRQAHATLSSTTSTDSTRSSSSSSQSSFPSCDCNSSRSVMQQSSLQRHHWQSPSAAAALLHPAHPSCSYTTSPFPIAATASPLTSSPTAFAASTEAASTPSEPRLPPQGPRSAFARRHNVPVGWKKLDFVLRMVRRRHVDEALAQLAVCPKKAAPHIARLMQLAKANAINQGLQPERLVVDEAFVNKGQYIKRPAYMGRGYHSFKEQQRTHLTITLKEDPAVRPWTRLLKPYSLFHRHSGSGSSSSGTQAKPSRKSRQRHVQQ